MREHRIHSAGWRRWKWALLVSLMPLFAYPQQPLDIVWMLGSGGRPEAISANGETLVFQQGGYLSLWQLSNQRLVRTFPLFSFFEDRYPSRLQVALSPDGTRMAMTAIYGEYYYEEHTVFVLIDPQTGTLIRRLEFSYAENGPPAFSPDGSQVAFSVSGYSIGHRLLILRTSDGQVEQEITAPFLAEALRYLSDGRLLTAGMQTDGYPWTWEVFSNTLRRIDHRYNWGYYDTNWQFSPDGAYLIVYTDSPTVRFGLYDVTQGQLIRFEEDRRSFRSFSAEFSYDSQAVIFSMERYESGTWRTFIQVRQPSTGEVVRQWADIDIGSGKLLSHPFRTEVFVHNRILNWITGEWVGEVGHFRPLSSNVRPPLFSPDGQFLVIAGIDGVSVWRVHDRALHYHLKFPEVLGCWVSPNSRVLAVALRNEIRLYNLASGTLRRSLPEPLVYSSLFSPDSSLLAVSLYPARASEVRLYHVETGVLQHVLMGATLPLAFSPDGRYLATDNAVWQLPEEIPVFTFNWLRGTTWAAVFSADGNWLASGSIYRDEDSGSHSWDLVGDFQLLRVGSWEQVAYRQERGAVKQLAFLPDGQHLIVSIDTSGGWIEGYHHGGALFIWRMPSFEATLNLRGLPRFTLSSTSRYLLTALHSARAQYGSPYYESNTLFIGWVHRGQIRQARQYQEDATSEVGRPFAVAISPDERLIAYARVEGVVVVARNPFYTPYGDVDGNGCVDEGDLLAVLLAFGTTESTPDVNGDGQVDDADLLIVLFNFGMGC